MAHAGGPAAGGDAQGREDACNAATMEVDRAGEDDEEDWKEVEVVAEIRRGRVLTSASPLESVEGKEFRRAIEVAEAVGGRERTSSLASGSVRDNSVRQTVEVDLRATVAAVAALVLNNLSAWTVSGVVAACCGNSCGTAVPVLLY